MTGVGVGVMIWFLSGELNSVGDHDWWCSLFGCSCIGLAKRELHVCIREAGNVPGPSCQLRSLLCSVPNGESVSSDRSVPGMQS